MLANVRAIISVLPKCFQEEIYRKKSKVQVQKSDSSDPSVNLMLLVSLQKCKGHFHVATYMVISVQRFPMVAVLLQSLTTNSRKQNVAIRISL